MILIADSGSTKADWIAGENQSMVAEFHTKGFNPFFHDNKFIVHELNNNPGINAIKNKVSEIYFFGAGCSSSERNEIISNGLAEFFTKATVVVEHDMLGTALAVCEGKKGIACILGTGSNTCYFDGKRMDDIRHGLGYIIGDEGSGSYYGKKLLAAYLYQLLPADLHESFTATYHLDKEGIISKVYKESDPNVFLASFATFLSDHQSHPYIAKLIHKGMTEFFETNVLSYAQYAEVPVHFVGSIAWFFRDILNQVADEKGVSVGNIIRKPITGLASYFLHGGKMP